MSIGLYKIKYYKLIACSPFGLILRWLIIAYNTAQA